MSYLPGTVLSRKAPLGDHLDELRVVGNSPIQQPSVAAWAGATGEAMIVAPHKEFGSNETMPISYAAKHYEIVSIPEEPVVPVETRRRPTTAGLKSPEQQFAEQARIEPKRPVAPKVTK